MAFHDSETDFTLKNIDKQVENPALRRLSSLRAKGKLNFITPKENESATQLLVFRHNTKAQERTRKRQQPKRLEPLVSLKISILATFGYRESWEIALGDRSFSRFNKEEMKTKNLRLVYEVVSTIAYSKNIEF